MQSLIEELTRKLGVSAAQARGGAGLVFIAAKDKLGAADFDRLLAHIEGVPQLLQAAPVAGRAGKLFGRIASAAGGDRAAMIAQVVSGFARLGMTTEHAKAFAPIILEHMRGRLDPASVSEIEQALRA